MEGRTGKGSGYSGHQEKHRGLRASWSQGFLTSEFLELCVVGEAEGTENPGQGPGQPDAKPTLSDASGFERAVRPLARFLARAPRMVSGCTSGVAEGWGLRKHLAT